MPAKLAARLPSPGDIAYLAGAGSLIYGAHQIYPPAAWILAGVGLLVCGFVLGLREEKA